MIDTTDFLMTAFIFLEIVADVLLFIWIGGFKKNFFIVILEKRAKG